LVSPALSPTRRTAILLTLCLSVFTINLDTTIVKSPCQHWCGAVLLPARPNATSDRAAADVTGVGDIGFSPPEDGVDPARRALIDAPSRRSSTLYVKGRAHDQ
jgi:hypothetical protein